uniref:Uncharacterized protein n=1 Tax=Nelumbo nucifera TaxID=4432 RepID=A0A822YZD1_NELNU|nr:TPA_asm: hypothetical protein HUJ06_005218 [Nelumbo nucifera]
MSLQGIIIKETKERLTKKLLYLRKKVRGHKAVGKAGRRGAVQTSVHELPSWFLIPGDRWVVLVFFVCSVCIADFWGGFPLVPARLGGSGASMDWLKHCIFCVRCNHGASFIFIFYWPWGFMFFIWLGSLSLFGLFFFPSFHFYSFFS